MREQEGMKPQIPPSGHPQAEPQQFAAEIARAEETAQRALQEAGEAHLETEQFQVQVQSHRRSVRALWGAVVMVGLVLAGITAYGYHQGQRFEDLLTRFPGTDNSLQAVSQRLQTAEEALQSRTQEWSNLVPRVAEVEKKVQTNLRLVQDFARQQVSEVHHQLVQEIDNRTEWMEARMQRMESDQESQRAQFRQLQQEMAAAQHETAQQLSQVRREFRGSFEVLNLQAAGDRRVLTDLALELDQRRVDFELGRNRNQELVPGVSLTVNGTDVRTQRVRGFLQLVPDGRTLWLQNQGILQPLFFFKQEENRPYQVVFSRVTPDSVIGYVLVPGTFSPGSGVADSGGSELSMPALAAR